MIMNSGIIGGWLKQHLTGLKRKGTSKMCKQGNLNQPSHPRNLIQVSPFRSYNL